MTNPLPLETQVGQLLLDKGYTISTAESCTGGLIASRLTDIPGSSAYVLGAVVTYSNEAKQQLVKVREETLIQFGAVSEQTAQEMALGVQKLFGTNLAVSVTGIAGPGGGTDEKPVGLTYIGLAVNDSVEVRKFIWGGTRIHNKTASADAAFEMILQAFS